MRNAILLFFIFGCTRLSAQCRPDGKYDGILFTFDNNIPASLIFSNKGMNLFAQTSSKPGLICLFSKPEVVDVNEISFSDNNYVVDLKSTAGGTVNGKCLKILKLLRVYTLEISCDRHLVLEVNKGKADGMSIRTDTSIDVAVSSKKIFTVVFRKGFLYVFPLNIKDLLSSNSRKKEHGDADIRDIIRQGALNNSERGLMSAMLDRIDLGVKRITYQILDK